MISICLSLRGHRPILTKARERKKKRPEKFPFTGNLLLLVKSALFFPLSALLMGAALGGDERFIDYTPVPHQFA